MEYGAIDLHKKQSQIRILTAGGDVIEDRRIVTARERFTAVFGLRRPMRILVEASTESEWVARHLETLGHEVIVADPNYLPMYGDRSRRVKTDRRDVAALADACRRAVYRAAYRRSDQQRAVQAQLRVRQGLVNTRTRAISLARSLMRASGHHIRSGESASFLQRLAACEVPNDLTAILAPLRGVIEVVNDELASADTRFAALVENDPVIKRLTTLPGIGPLTASAFVAALDDVNRFRGAKAASQVTSYLGLVPREFSSGERQHRGHLVRSAQPQVQTLLVQAAWRVRRSTRSETAALRDWADRVSRRRGKNIATVALARRLARILFAMWRDEVDYQPRRIHANRQPQAATTEQPVARAV